MSTLHDVALEFFAARAAALRALAAAERLALEALAARDAALAWLRAADALARECAQELDAREADEQTRWDAVERDVERRDAERAA